MDLLPPSPHPPPVPPQTERERERESEKEGGGEKEGGRERTRLIRVSLAAQIGLVDPKAVGNRNIRTVSSCLGKMKSVPNRTLVSTSTW